MGKVRRFEELIAWQKARCMVQDIYETTTLDPFRGDFGLKDQIRRASVSVMSNIAEGFDRYRPKEFHHFLSIAKGSCAGVRSLLYVAYDVKYIDKDLFSRLIDQAEEVNRIVNKLRMSIKQNIDR